MTWVVAVLRFPFTLEALFVLFLFAGRFKGDERLAWVPVDLTGLLGALSLAAGGLVVLRQGQRVPQRGAAVVLLMVAFVAWLVLTLAWSPSAAYGPRKVLYLATLVLWALAAPALLIGPSRERVARLLVAFVAFGLWTAAETLQGLLTQGFGDVLMTFGMDYITLSSTLSITFITLAVWLLYTPRPGLLRGGAVVLTMGLLGLIILTGGGRGPILAMVLALGGLGIAVFVASSMRADVCHRVRRRVVVAGLVGVGAMGGLINWGTPLTTVNRIRIVFTAEGGGASVTDRAELVAAGLDQWAATPVQGGGAGGFAVRHGGVDLRWYPHNLFVEVLAEAGLVGFVLLAALLTVAVGLAWRRGAVSDPLFSSAFVIFLFALLSAQLSGDLSDNRPLFMAAGLLAGLASARG